MRRIVLLAALAALVIGCRDGSVEKETVKPGAKEGLVFIDPEKPFQIHLGRGSAIDGLETIAIHSDGQAIVVRDNRGNAPLIWKQAKLELPKETVSAVLTALHTRRVLGLNRAYTSSVADGMQWVFLARQGDQEKAIYFSNNFPEAITDFANDLDRILDDDRLDAKLWTPLRDQQHDKELWNSIAR